MRARRPRYSSSSPSPPQRLRSPLLSRVPSPPTASTTTLLNATSLLARSLSSMRRLRDDDDDGGGGRGSCSGCSSSSPTTPLRPTRSLGIARYRSKSSALLLCKVVANFSTECSRIQGNDPNSADDLNAAASATGPRNEPRIKCRYVIQIDCLVTLSY